MADGIPCRKCGKFEASHTRKKEAHPAEKLPLAIQMACEKFAKIDSAEVATQDNLKKCGLTWCQILSGDSKNYYKNYKL